MHPHKTGKAVSLPVPVCLKVLKLTEFFLSLQFSVLLAILATAVVVVGVLANSKRDEVRENTDKRDENQLMCPVCPDHKIVFSSLMLKVGIKLTEFYATLYAIYVKNQDPGIAVTLTFIHNAVRI